MEGLFVVLFFAVMIAALWFVPVHLWLREDVKFWRRQCEDWRNLCADTVRAWRRFKYIILRDGQPVAEFTDASLAKMALVMFQSNEAANGNTAHEWTMEGDQ